MSLLMTYTSFGYRGTITSERRVYFFFCKKKIPLHDDCIYSYRTVSLIIRAKNLNVYTCLLSFGAHIKTCCHGSRALRGTCPQATNKYN